jgi:hypothetical protein
MVIQLHTLNAKKKKKLRRGDPLSPFFFFNLVVDVQSKILRNVKILDYIKRLGKFNKW